MTTQTELEFRKVVCRTPVGTFFEVDSNEGDTIWELVDSFEIPVNSVPTVCVIDGQPVMREKWDKTIEGSLVEFVVIPRGKRVTQILGIVASIALAVVAGPIGGFLASALGITSTIGIALLKAGVLLVGSLLLNSLTSSSQTDERTGSSSDTSPTYNINAQGNLARPFQAIPIIRGEHITYPDFASQPYTFYQSNEQYLCQLLTVGLGEYLVTELKLGDTVFWTNTGGVSASFESVEVEVLAPNQPVTLFHPEVIVSNEVSSHQLSRWDWVDADLDYGTTYNSITLYDGGPLVGGFARAVIGQEIVVSGSISNDGVYTIVDKTSDESTILVFPPLLANETTGTSSISLTENSSWVGPFAVCPSNRYVSYIEIDLSFPSGLYLSADPIESFTVYVLVEARKIDEEGNAIGSWTTLGIHDYTKASREPQRITEGYVVEDGRYEVRVRRLTEEGDFNNEVSLLTWEALKGYVPDVGKYENVTTIALKMRATGQLTQQSSRRISAIVRGKIREYDATTQEWTEPKFSTSPAWIAVDALTSEWGGNMPTTKIDLETFAALHDQYEARGDQFNGVFDTKQSVWDAVSDILRVGRTVPVRIGRLVSARRLEWKEIPRGVFNNTNMVTGSFSTEHIMHNSETPDYTIVEFMDRRTWKQNEVKCVVPGGTEELANRVFIKGITDRYHAWREGIYMSGYNYYARIGAQFTTELEGRLLTRGDQVIVAHDLYEWGSQGLVDSYDTDTKTVTLDQEVVLDGSMVIVFKDLTGRAYGPITITQGDTDYEVVLDAGGLAAVEATRGDINDIWGDTDNEQYTQWIIASTEQALRRFSVISGTPAKEPNQINLVCMIDDPIIHTLDGGTPPTEGIPSDIMRVLPEPLINLSGSGDVGILIANFTTDTLPYISHVKVYVSQIDEFDEDNYVKSIAVEPNTVYNGQIIEGLDPGLTYIWFRPMNGVREGDVQGSYSATVT